MDALPAWDADRPFPSYREGKGWVCACERKGVFFSHPLDLDLMMLEAYPEAYGVAAKVSPSESTTKAVLGKSYVNVHHYDDAQLELFDEYQKQFKLGSKPASHLGAMAAFDGKDDALLAGLPGPLRRLLDAVKERLESIPE